MPDAAPDLTRAVFAKTAVGQQEIQTRSLGLGPLPRRLLVLVDGKRNGQELAAFVAGHDVNELLTQLMEKECIEAIVPVAPVIVVNASSMAHAADRHAPDSPPDTLLAELPAAEMRDDKEVEMARSFMTNTVNFIFGQNTRMVMLEAISDCQTAQELRQIYPKWVELMLTNRDGAKRLPELRKQLSKVL
jgi:hypothetical protein